LRCGFFGVVKAPAALADQLVMDPSVSRRADAASRAHLVLAFACLPFVGAAVGALAALAHVAPSTLGAAALAVGVLSGPLAAVALRLSASRAVEPEAVPASPAIVQAPVLHPRERFLRELMTWRATPWRRSAR
jgi:hypothetical protein